MSIYNISREITGVVLAGGMSRRFGEDKALSKFGHTTMIGHAIALLRAVTQQVFVVTHPMRDYLGFDVRIIHDIIPDKGPIGGLYTACQYATTPLLLVLTCDMPRLTPHLIFGLLLAHEPGKCVSVYDNMFGVQPFPGLYSKTVETQVRTSIEQNHLKMQDLLFQLPSLQTIKINERNQELVNINTQDDLAIA